VSSRRSTPFRARPLVGIRPVPHDRPPGAATIAVKHNQPGLFAALDALPWTDAPIAHRQTDRGHGRITTRTIQTLPAPPDLPFPHVGQVWLIERYVTDLAGVPTSAIAALGITNLRPDQATPADIARLRTRPTGRRQGSTPAGRGAR
jgi:hypothetical protein